MALADFGVMKLSAPRSHSREKGNPELFNAWTPASAGVTNFRFF